MIESGMLAQWVDVTDVDQVVTLCESDAWVAEQKMDGVRLVVVWDHGDVRLHHRDGEPMKHAASALCFPALERELRVNLPEQVSVTLDCELLPGDDGVAWVFDVPHLGGDELASEALTVRRAALEGLFRNWVGDHFRLMPQARTHLSKVRLVQGVRAAGAEGCVFKRADSTYQPGVRSANWLKLKFYKEVDCVVTALGTGGAKNAELAVCSEDPCAVCAGTGLVSDLDVDPEYFVDAPCPKCLGAGLDLLDVGRTSMIGKDERIRVGSVVEVKYLFYDDKLNQPSILRMREDKTPDQCKFDQLVPVNRDLITLEDQ